MATQFPVSAHVIAKSMIASFINRSVILPLLENGMTGTFNENAVYGDTVNITVPAQAQVADGLTAVYQDMIRTTKPVVIDQAVNHVLELSARQNDLAIKDLKAEVLDEAAGKIAEEFDIRAALRMLDSAATITSTAATNGTSAELLTAITILRENSVPNDILHYVTDPQGSANYVEKNKALFHASQNITSQYRAGKIATDTLGFEVSVSNNLPVHQPGAAFAFAITVNGAGQFGRSLNVTMGSAPALNTVVFRRGDVFTIDNVLAVKLRNQFITGRPAQFAVAQDVLFTGSLNLVVPITEPIIPADSITPLPIIGVLQKVNPQSSGNPALNQEGGATANLRAYATVNTLPAAGAAVRAVYNNTKFYVRSYAFHPKSYGYVFSKQYQPKGLDLSAAMTDPASGISMFFGRDYQIVPTKKMIMRIDASFGIFEMRTPHCVSIAREL